MNKSSKTGSTAAKRTEKQVQRAERNRARTVKHVYRLLSQIQDNTLQGFNHFEWESAAEAFSQVSSFLSPEEYSAIGKAWSNIYATDDASEMVSVIKMVKERFVSGPYSLQE